jgi:hypothetical protein
MNTTTEPGDGFVHVTFTLGNLVQDKLLLVAKPFYPHLLEHSGPEGPLSMSSLDNILDGEETLTWVEQHEITATVRDERWDPYKEERARTEAADSEIHSGSD